MTVCQIIIRLCFLTVGASSHEDFESIDERSLKVEHIGVDKPTDILPIANPQREKICLIINIL